MDSLIPGPVAAALDLLVTLFVFVIGLGVAALIVVFVIDITQHRDAIRRNYPVVGRFRYLFSTLGEFFRQYFFAMDREEMPFNRAERQWAARAASGRDNTVAFGSTKNLTTAGTFYFVNCPFPTLDSDRAETEAMIIGPTAREPYCAPSFFNISGMSYGALSKPAVRALSRGAGLAGCWLNTGEGGLAPFHLEGNCDIIFQIGTAKYGVRDADGSLSDDRLRSLAENPRIRMFEIKLSQGAKPGKGGILPAVKVTEEIAAIRGIPAGKDSISPNRHTDIGSIGDLLDRIAHIREVTGRPVGFKCVIGAYGWLDALFEEVKRRGTDSAPDFITVDSGDGGTGAAPLPLIDNVGLPIRESLPMVDDIRKRHGMKDRIRLIASGKFVTPSGVAWALCAGADFVVAARGFMFALGCIQSLKCNKNTCPTGITTHNTRLQRGLNPVDKGDRVANYCISMRNEVEVIAHSCGVPEPRRLRRFHVRIVEGDGRSIPFNELYPSPDDADNDPAAAILAGRAEAAEPAPVQPADIAVPAQA
ncbi:MAG: FMN-binding glutamate synthase family protein [Bauldia sp.]|uniref:FMN-binding glutamate synthase family protein n=1 Tax=Bauldia sp. TaxID=2575872 RepID=UPI001DCC3719|nr:FMN-binding glutamate synthase family protein [Bauldia sp.]MCB1495770.1 FMN-binding glutamate synthase family protein [Bauldia sp.]